MDQDIFAAVYEQAGWAMLAMLCILALRRLLAGESVRSVFCLFGR